MLIDADGTKQGLVSFEQALGKAKDASLDLVQVSPQDSNPVVCKLLDYGKHLFNKKKNTASLTTFVNNAIFSLEEGGITFEALQTKISG